MRVPTMSGALPLRPMAVSELLDAATTLLRTRAPVLLGAGFLLALLEQAALFPLRQLADQTYVFFPDEDGFGWFALLFIIGFVTETICITVLGAMSAAAAPRAMLGAGAPPRPVRPFGAEVLTAVIAVICAVAALSIVLGPVAYLLLGLAMPALVIDRLGPGAALLRSIRLTVRNGMRAGWIRLLGYLSWMLIRLAVGLAGWAALVFVIDTGTALGDHVATALAWLLVNALAYPALACLDTVLHLETRMRTEGLDIMLQLALRRSVSADTALAVPK